MARTVDELRRFLAGHGVDATEPALLHGLAQRGWLVFHDEAVPGGHEIRAEFLGNGTDVITARSDRGYPDRLGYRVVALMRALERAIDLADGAPPSSNRAEPR